MDKPFTSYRIEERSYLAYVKREIRNQVSQSLFNKNRAGEIDIIVSELASNLVKHAGNGELLYRIFQTESDATFEIISIDKGPGMSDAKGMIKDGISTTKTLGQGLGAVSRLSDTFEIFSMNNWGTIAYSKVLLKKEGPVNKSDRLKVRGLLIPKANEVLCGDGYATRSTRDEIHFFLGDGLGHGQYAFEAVKKAADFFLMCEESNPVDIIRQMHENVRKTRGLVAVVAVFNFKTNVWRICGVGNILARIYSGLMFKNYSSYNGIVGLTIPTSIKESVIEGEKNQYIIMCSDGLKTHWDLQKYPSILKYDATIAAAALYKDFVRRTDDASILIGKIKS